MTKRSLTLSVMTDMKLTAGHLVQFEKQSRFILLIAFVDGIVTCAAFAENEELRILNVYYDDMTFLHSRIIASAK